MLYEVSVLFNNECDERAYNELETSVANSIIYCTQKQKYVFTQLDRLLMTFRDVMAQTENGSDGHQNSFISFQLHSP
jgi:hypothetical protein